MRRRWACVLVLAVCLVVLLWGAWWTIAEGRFQAGLAWAKAEIAGQRYEPARRWLAAQSAGRPAAAEVDYWLGVCERAQQHPEAAVAGWARVPLKSPFGVKAALERALTLINDLGRYAEGELVLTEALACAGPDAAQIRSTL